MTAKKANDEDILPASESAPRGGQMAATTTRTPCTAWPGWGYPSSHLLAARAGRGD